MGAGFDLNQLSVDKTFKLGVNTVQFLKEIHNQNLKRPVRSVAGPGIFVPYAKAPESAGTRTSQKLGAAARYLRALPEPDLFSLAAFADYVARDCNAKIKPPPADELGYFEQWLSGMNKPQWRKDQLRKADAEFVETNAFMSQLMGKVKWMHGVGAFSKLESYPKFAYERTINARRDETKNQLGPWTSLVEHLVFSTDPDNPFAGDFIKKVKMADRARFLRDKFEGFTRCAATDYSKFEASFIVVMMLVCEYAVLSAYLRHTSHGRVFLRHYREAVMSTNVIRYSTWACKVDGKRMSGEMTTSLGNGLMNRYLCHFEMWRRGFQGQFAAVFEGDDGLIGLPVGYDLSRPFLPDMGFEVKFDVYEHWTLASFCGNLVDEDSLTIVTDPFYVMSEFPWLNPRYLGARNTSKLALMRAKALSLLHQLPGCPILQDYALNALHRSRGVSLKRVVEGGALNAWEADHLSDAMKDFGVGYTFSNENLPVRPVAMSARLFFERCFGISVEQQMSLESWLRSPAFQERNSQVSLPTWVTDLMPSCYIQNYLYYVRPSVDANYPQDRYVEDVLCCDCVLRGDAAHERCNKTLRPKILSALFDDADA